MKSFCRYVGGWDINAESWVVISVKLYPTFNKIISMFGTMSTYLDTSVTRLDDFLHFGQLFEAFGNN